MRRRPETVWLVAALLSLAAKPAVAGAISNADLDAFMRKAMTEWSIPGASIAVVRDGRVLVLRGFGTRTAGRHTPVDANTVFAIGSATKAMTVAALGALVDERRLEWDARIADLLPGFRLTDAQLSQTLTLRDLLAHRTGLERADAAWYLAPDAKASDIRCLVSNLRVLEPPRTRFRYNNLAYALIDEIVRIRTGAGWRHLVESRVLAPLGMTRSSTSVSALRRMVNTASPHERINRDLRTVPWRNIDAVAPAGAVNSTARDMARWLMANLRLLGEVTHDTPSDTTVAEQRKQASTVPDLRALDLIAPGATRWGYGLGWRLHDYRGLDVVDHTGGIDGFSAEVTLVPSLRLGIVTLANRGGDDNWFPTAVKYWLLDRLIAGGDGRRAYDAVLAEARARTALPSPAGSLTGPPPPPAALGTYSSPLFGSIRILPGGRIALGGAVEWRGRLVKRQDEQFSVRSDAYGLDGLHVAFEPGGRQARAIVLGEAGGPDEIRLPRPTATSPPPCVGNPFKPALVHQKR